jgi:hypothetical protein
MGDLSRIPRGELSQWSTPNGGIRNKEKRLINILEEKPDYLVISPPKLRKL